MTLRSCVVVVIECNHAGHPPAIHRKSSFSGETVAAAAEHATDNGWASLGNLGDQDRKHWCPHCLRRERAAGNV